MPAFLRRVFPLRRPSMLVVLSGLSIVAYLAAFWLRSDLTIDATEWGLVARTLPVLLLLRLLAFAWFHVYQGVWRYTSLAELADIGKAVTAASALFAGYAWVAHRGALPGALLFVEWLLALAAVVGVLLVLRAIHTSSNGGTKVIIVGAGDAGEALAREILRDDALDYTVVAFVDDDPRKQRRRIHGIEVAGGVDDLPRLAGALGVEEILVAIPSSDTTERQRILQRCRESGVTFKTVPPYAEIVSGRARVGQLQDVRPEDLLPRSPVRLDVDGIARELTGKRILVTGAGGSIGSELCRQCAAFRPERLVLLERAESALYFAELDLRRRHPQLDIVAVVGDICDRRKLDEVMREHRPEVVYHAAAYKHVPLMEAHPLEAIQNNVEGTENVARAALDAGVRKVVLISTDKAVRPVGIMGMTKRVAELVMLSLQGGPTTFVAVRFGNVLGSEGSIFPLFQWQIACGGPVTVTDREATRYFMLISEAAQLVLQAGAMGRGGEVFFLDMGEPMRVLDLAENLIRYSGLQPGRDMPVKLVGLRNGERLREELVMEKEELLESGHEKVFMVKSRQFERAGFLRDRETLAKLLRAWDRDRAVAQLREMATRY